MASLYRENIRTLKGVGDRRARLFQKLGVTSVGALLRLYPRAYEDLSHPYPVREAPVGEPCAVRATVTRSLHGTRIRGGMTLYQGMADDGGCELALTFFNNPYVTSMLKEGNTYIFYGKITQNFLRRGMNVPEFFPADSCPAVRPIYPQTEGLNSRMIWNAVKEALLCLPEPIIDPIPEELREKYSLCGLRDALENIHIPSGMGAVAAARRRLIFEELLVLQLGLFRMKSRNVRESRYRFSRDCTKEFWSLLPFRPTGAQRRAVRESMTDLASGRPMSRLIQGDVGSGKTAVAAALCYCAARNGYQAALMAPTEILARQHYESLRKIFEPAGVQTALLTGSVPAAEKKKILSALADGSTGLAVGTHALFSKNVVFRRLGLVVTDEQHRFGVAQRAALSKKGDNPHLLVMSATPIPRTLALMVYGDLDLSVLDELPPGRQTVKTYAVTSALRPRIFHFLDRQIAAGRQCYIICPTIDGDRSGMASVTQYAKALQGRWLPNRRIGVLHGRMKGSEKEAVMGRFASGTLDLLVSTTVVEVGMDVPNATVMMVENAERYGLSQLHQLRGRVGRGTEQSYCILVSDAKGQTAKDRLGILCRTCDGFKIADEDLRLRGPGDFFGNRQHGLPALKIADMATDMDCLHEAQDAAKLISACDPALNAPEHRGLRAEMRQLFSQVELA